MLRMMKISEIHKLQVACFMFKVHRNHLTASFLDMFNANIAIYYRRANNYHFIDMIYYNVHTSIRYA